MELIKITPRFILEVLKHDFVKKIKERWNESFIRQVVRTNDFAISNIVKASEKHNSLAAKKRKALNYDNYDQIHVQDVNLIPTTDNQPILFEHVYIRETKENFSDPNDIESSISEAENTPYK